MALYLHSRLTDAAAVQRVVADSVAEDDHLEFKQRWWPDGVEASKDVAALANNEGGDLVVGIQEGAGGVAAGYLPLAAQARSRDPEQTLRQWLHNHLAPAQVANTIELQEIALPIGSSVLVISVPPWPDGVVGVGTSGGENWRFPYRTGAHTLFWGWEEVLMRSDGQARRAYLRVRDLAAQGLSRVAIASPIVGMDQGRTVDLAGHDLERGSQAFLSGLPTQDSLKVQMRSRVSQSVVSIPWEFVRAVWRDPQDNISLALSARLIVDDRQANRFWRLEYRG